MWPNLRTRIYHLHSNVHNMQSFIWIIFKKFSSALKFGWKKRFDWFRRMFQTVMGSSSFESSQTSRAISGRYFSFYLCRSSQLLAKSLDLNLGLTEGWLTCEILNQFKKGWLLYRHHHFTTKNPGSWVHLDFFKSLDSSPCSTDESLLL